MAKDERRIRWRITLAVRKRLHLLRVVKEILTVLEQQRGQREEQGRNNGRN